MVRTADKKETAEDFRIMRPKPSCTRVIQKVSDLDILDNNIFHNLYISETHILYEL